MEKMVAAQGGDASVVADPSKLAVAPEVVRGDGAASGLRHRDRRARDRPRRRGDGLMPSNAGSIFGPFHFTG